MKKLIQRLNQATILPILAVVYLLGFGLAATIWRIYSLSHQTDQTTFWRPSSLPIKNPDYFKSAL